MTPESRLQPEDDGAAWLAHMRRGDYAAAWAVSDRVLRARAGTPCWHWPRHQQYVWDGRPLDGRRVLVRCYHGLGDTIQFVRYAAPLRAVAARVTLWAQPALLDLVRTARGVDEALPLHDGTPDVEYDADVEIMELAHVLRSTLDTLPAEVPYLSAGGPAARLAARPARPRGAPLAVGVVWRAGDWDERRSIPFPLVATLAEAPGVELHVLQRGPALAECPDGFGVRSGTDDVVAAARLMNRLDLVLSVDSMPAHLAGALGRPVWTLLHADPDWRWMLGRDDTPWYPTMRLFRQPRPGDWAAVMARVRAELAALA
jgi:hypothetical protein